MKVYAVNGAAHPGFGEMTARKILSEGNRVIGFFNSEDFENAKSMQKEFSEEKLKMIPIDLFDLDSLKDIMNQINESIDGFVNADFMFEMENVDDFDYKLSEKIFLANYHAPMLMAVELKKKMNSNASIVIVTSTESERGSFGGVSYAASKAAVHNMIKSLACNWGKNKHIRVNAVAAGWIGGEMDTDGPFEVSINITPLGRLGRAEEVANSVYFLLSEESSFVNAQILYVDGGYLAVDDIAKYEYEVSKA